MSAVLMKKKQFSGYSFHPAIVFFFHLVIFTLQNVDAQPNEWYKNRPRATFSRSRKRWRLSSKWPANESKSSSVSWTSAGRYSSKRWFSTNSRQNRASSRTANQSNFLNFGRHSPMIWRASSRKKFFICPLNCKNLSFERNGTSCSDVYHLLLSGWRKLSGRRQPRMALPSRHLPAKWRQVLWRKDWSDWVIKAKQ